jgi:hypothetical protein
MDNEQGQSLVELGLAITFLMFLLAGAVEFGMVFFQYVQLHDAAQEGALYGSICNCPSSDIEVRARGASNSPINLQDDSVSIVVFVKDKNGIIKDTACEQDGLTVRVHYTHKIFMPFLPQMLGRDYIDLVGNVTNTVLYPIC